MSKSSQKTVIKTAEEWLKANPFLTKTEAQSLADNPPPLSPTQEHDNLWEDSLTKKQSILRLS